MGQKQTEKPVVRDTEVALATKATTSLLVEAERLTHRLNVHLDNIQEMIEERKALL